MSNTLEDRLRSEVEDVHAFIAQWFRGEVANDKALFDARLSDRFAPGLVNIQPSGEVLTRETLLGGIFKAHGSNPAFAITIRDFALLPVLTSDDHVLALYTEYQTGAKNTDPPDNARRSTVLFDVSDMERGPLWLHIHETGVG